MLPSSLKADSEDMDYLKPMYVFIELWKSPRRYLYISSTLEGIDVKMNYK